MTSSVKVQSHNFPVLVQTLRVTPAMDGAAELEEVSSEQILWPEDGEMRTFVTTTQGLRILDLEPDDPRVNVKPE